MSARRIRTGPEWITFAASCVVLAALVVVIGWLWVNDDQPARIQVHTVGVQQIGDDQLEITVDVVNSGDRTAVDVQVIGELITQDGPQQFGEQSVDFLTGGETSTVVFVAPTVDAQSVAVRVGSFSRP